MDRLLTINGKNYKAAEFDVNFACDMEDNGIDFEHIDKKMFNLLRMYVALSMGVDPKEAGNAISEHVKNGGTIDEISDVMAQMMEESDFFRTEPKDKEKTGPAKPRKKKTESEEVTF